MRLDVITHAAWGYHPGLQGTQVGEGQSSVYDAGRVEVAVYPGPNIV